jgi:hypothetical protein
MSQLTKQQIRAPIRTKPLPSTPQPLALRRIVPAIVAHGRRVAVAVGLVALDAGEGLLAEFGLCVWALEEDGAAECVLVYALQALVLGAGLGEEGLQVENLVLEGGSVGGGDCAGCGELGGEGCARWGLLV